jgi:hypothetical protein
LTSLFIELIDPSGALRPPRLSHLSALSTLISPESV